MSEETNRQIPASPETQPGDVRKELDQNNVTHEGKPLEAQTKKADSDKYMGATEENVTTISPPMEGPGKVTNGEDEDTEMIDPESELTPG